jgi:hypothetical protein
MRLCGYTHPIGGSIFRENHLLVGSKRQNARKRPPRGVCVMGIVLVAEYKKGLGLLSSVKVALPLTCLYLVHVSSLLLRPFLRQYLH